jgi:hypothetical protein
VVILRLVDAFIISHDFLLNIPRRLCWRIEAKMDEYFLSEHQDVSKVSYVPSRGRAIAVKG